MRTVASGVLLAVIGTAVLASPSVAQPGSAEREQARQLYVAAEQAMEDGRIADALRDYGAAYALTKDPVLFYKLGAAHERAGSCDVALTYYRRYLDEAKPTGEHLALVRERMSACDGDAPVAPSDAEAAPGPADPAATPTPEPAPTAPAATEPEPAPPPPVMVRPQRGPWLLVTGSLAFVTIGAVLAYSAESAENDIADLYVGFGGQPPVFDARTRATYDDLVDEGRRYQRLSWLSFGLAAATAVGATVWFLAADDEPALRVSPAVTPAGAGVSASLRF